MAHSTASDAALSLHSDSSSPTSMLRNMTVFSNKALLNLCLFQCGVVNGCCVSHQQNEPGRGQHPRRVAGVNHRESPPQADPVVKNCNPPRAPSGCIAAGRDRIRFSCED